MVAKCFIAGTLFAPVCGIGLKLNLIPLSILCFSIFLCFTLSLLLFENYFYNLWIWL